MKTNKEDIDKLIKETLTKEEAKFYDELDEQGLFGMVKGLLKGKNSWLVVIMNIFSILVFVLLIYCIIQTTEVERANDLILWVGAAIFCLIIISVIKINFWMHMHKNAVIRELKRLEIQISSLSGRMPE
jgi:hypothetical protein